MKNLLRALLKKNGSTFLRVSETLKCGRAGLMMSSLRLSRKSFVFLAGWTTFKPLSLGAYVNMEKTWKMLALKLRLLRKSCKTSSNHSQAMLKNFLKLRTLCVGVRTGTPQEDFD